MRIAIVTHNIIKGDGQGRANYEIARYAASKGAQVTLIADRVAEDLEGLQNIEWVKVQPKMRKTAITHDMEFRRNANQILAQRRGVFDIIHAYGNTMNGPHDLNTVQFVHSAWRQSPMHVAKQHKNLYGAYQWFYSAYNAKGERQAFRDARFIVAASSTVKAELIELGVSPERLRVILNGADLNEFHPGPANRKALGLPEQVPLAVFAGDIRTNRKNLDSVLKAVRLSPETHLAVVGRKEGSPFPQMAQELGIEQRVHFLDFRRDMADIMRASDMFVFPSRYEACALVLVEAIASGLPVITAKTTGGSEILTPESGIVLSSCEDVEGIAAGMRELSADETKRKAMSAAAAERARDYSWTQIVEQYYDVYQMLASQKAT